MSTDGINPFMNSSTHSTLQIVLTILNLPPWLCNKRKYIVMSGLIPGHNKVVSITSSRRGGTKFINRAGASGKQMRVGGVRLSS
jgi:hypothetical protein